MTRLGRLPQRLLAGARRVGWRHPLLLGTGVVALMLMVEGFALRDPFEPAPRDIDASVKRAQTLGLAGSGLRSQALPYRARYLDPQQWYLPFVKPFVIRTRTGMQSIFPTAAAMVDVPSEWLGGLAALRMISIAVTLLSVVLTLRLIRGRPDAFAPAVMVLATPLWFYALGGTSHPVGLVLATAAVFAALDGRRAFAAGLLLGLASTVRDEALALAPGLLLVGAWQWRTLGPLARMAAGAAIPVAVMALVDQQFYGRPAAAHLLHAIRGTFFPDAPTGVMAVLEAMSWRDRLDVVVVYWLDGRSLMHAALLAASVAFAAVVRMRTGSFWGALPALAIVLVDTAADCLMMINAPKRIPGLMRLAPFLVFAVLPHADTPPDQARRRVAALLVSAAFVLVAVATTNTSGGKPLGPRLLLPIWPLLVGLAWNGVKGHALAGRRTRAQQVLAAGGSALVVAGFFINAVTLMPMYRAVEAESIGAARYLAGTAEQVIVIGSPFAIDPVIGVYPSRSVMLAASAADAADIAQRLERSRIRRFLFVRRNDREDLAAVFPSFDVDEELVFGRWIVQRWASR